MKDGNKQDVPGTANECLTCPADGGRGMRCWLRNRASASKEYVSLQIERMPGSHHGFFRERKMKTAIMIVMTFVSVTDGNRAVEDGGPTVPLSYSIKAFERSPIGSFMYFIPLISPVAVGRETGPDNQQQVGVVSYERKVTANSFSVTCEFEMLGSGFNKYLFDPKGMIATSDAASDKDDTRSHLLDYINFEGTGFGSIQIKGTIAGSAETVTEVEVRFNARGRKSPVTIGLYDIKPKDGQYRYENRSNEIVARVNTLTFKKSENPRMGITVASIGKKGANGFVGHVKGAVANLFIKPVKVDPLGNETMLKFGYALLQQEPAFTFPKAGNFKDIKLAMASPKPE
jgi:hypothetical protein